MVGLTTELTHAIHDEPRSVTIALSLSVNVGWCTRANTTLTNKDYDIRLVNSLTVGIKPKHNVGETMKNLKHHRLKKWLVVEVAGIWVTVTEGLGSPGTKV